SIAGRMSKTVGTRVFLALSLLGLALVTVTGCSQGPIAPAKASFWPLLENANERVVITTIHRLSAIGGDDVIIRIAGIMADDQRSDQVRIAAALGLGTIGTPSAGRALIEDLEHTPSSDLAKQILNSLGQFNFPKVASTF